MNNVISSTAKIFRNIKDYKFSNKLTQEKQQEIIEKLKEVLTDFEYVDITKTGEETFAYLNENFAINSGVKTLFLNKTKNVCINLFNEEHLTIISTDHSSDLAYKNVKEISEELANKISMSYSDEFGYLMSNITHIGSGLKLESEICLICIEEIGKIEQIKQNIKKLGYLLTETDDSHIYTLSTTCNLGVAEKDIVLEFKKMLEQLQEVEIESAKMLDLSNRDEMIDKSMRSLALLKGSYLMTCGELSSHITNLRTALNLNYLNMDAQTLNKLQKLSKTINTEYISQTELKQLANKARQILKGEENV